MKERILRYWTYFRRGHGTYLAFLLSFANFMVIQYRLLIEYMPALKAIFSQLLIFAATFFLVYVPIATVIGWYDYRKFAVPVDASIAAKTSPWARDLARALMFMAEGKNKDAIEILKKWVEKM